MVSLLKLAEITEVSSNCLHVNTAVVEITALFWLMCANRDRNAGITLYSLEFHIDHFMYSIIALGQKHKKRQIQGWLWIKYNSGWFE